MIDWSFRDFVGTFYGPFKSDDELDLFIDDRSEELREAFDAYLREIDELESLEDDEI
ncbi:hypothetical protein AB4Z34_01515 [Ensifer sp. 2YAB10]|uniref:hypothetical protein n=1 Tax=unclassified Ensifer TaxID=2633371 RepID=UPI003F9042BB